MNICVFCGAKPGVHPLFMKEAFDFGVELAKRGHGLVYGGGRVGLMGAVADGALSVGGQVIGVIPQSLMDWEQGHLGVTKLHVVKSMHERKQLMADLSDAVVSLPGGFGTLDELCEIITWRQLSFHQKKIALLDTENYYQTFVQFLRHAEDVGFIQQSQVDWLFVSKQNVEVLDFLEK